MSEYEQSEDVLKILVATDNHLGYAEKDLIRGEDSYIAFEEILNYAVAHEVDMILLGGDLFHEANPTTNALNRCLNLLRKSTLGDKPILLEILSDQNLNFYNSFNKTVNYEDPHINIAIPVFSIHGNHDDPSGFARLSSLDVLSTSGLINYFGKWTDLTNININPIMIRKGETHLALYGLSYIHDSRLNRLFQDSKVTMNIPEENTNEWFNLMVVHQNRADRGPKNYLPESILPEFLDLVIWGHEHDCRIVPEQNSEKNFHVSQPGSSVATSLADGESLKKHCGLLTIYKKKFKMTPLPLKTVRPFVFDTVVLNDHEAEIDEGDEDKNRNVQSFVKKLIDEMIMKAKSQLTGHRKQPTLPLIRLKIVYEDESQMFNAIRFGQNYIKRVANPKDILSFRKLKKRVKTDPSDFDKDVFGDIYNKEKDEKDEIRVEDVVHRYFDEVVGAKPLRVFATESLTEMCRRLVINDDLDAAERIAEFFKDKLHAHLKTTLPEDKDIESEIFKFKSSESKDFITSMFEMLDQRGNGYKPSYQPASNDLDALAESMAKKKVSLTNSNENQTLAPVSATTSRGRGKGRGAKSATRTARGSKTSATKASNKSLLDASTSKKSGQRSIQQSFSKLKRSSSRKPEYIDEVTDSE